MMINTTLLEEPKPTLGAWQALLSELTQLVSHETLAWHPPGQYIGVRWPGQSHTEFVLCHQSISHKPALLPSFTLFLGKRSAHIPLMLRHQPQPQGEELMRQTYRLTVEWRAPHLLPQGDLHIMEDLKIAPHPTHGYPFLRSTRPGFAPHPLTGQEAEIATLALRQIKALGSEITAGIATFPSVDDENILIRTRADGEWRTVCEIVEQDRKTPTRPIEVIVESELLDYLGQLPQAAQTVEVDCSPFDDLTVGDGDERPVIPYALVVVDPRDLSMLGAEVLDPSDGLRELWAIIPNLILIKLAENRLRPARLHMTSPLLYQIITPYTKQLQIETDLVDGMPGLKQAKRAFMHYFTGTE